MFLHIKSDASLLNKFMNMVSEKCYHCGDACGSFPVIFNDQNFCCQGCKTVYEILNDKKLFTYYKLQNAPGNKSDQSVTENKYAYLQHEEILSKILDFNQDHISKVTLFIPSIHCSSCIWLLENLNSLHDGITLSRVNFVQKKVYITFNNTIISLKQICELLESISYKPQIDIEEKNSKNESSGHFKKLVIKLGIAGFCFGNIMLLSFPEYFSAEATDVKTMNYFRWFNLMLSLPVFFYSASDFFESAYKNLVKRKVNIDLPVAIGILTIFLRSTYEIVSNTGPGYMDSLTGLVFFLLIGRWYQNKTYQALSFNRGFKSYFPLAANVIIQGVETPTPIHQIKPGDVMMIRHKELIPVDSVLKNGTGNIDYSFVTGESVPVTKDSGDKLYAGGRQIGNIITVEAIKEVSQSYFTQLWNREENNKQEKNISGVINTISKYFIAIIVLLSLTAFMYWQFHDPSKSFDAFTSILIIACPCALALATPFTFGAVMRVFARSGFFIRDTQIVENLSDINTMVFDKTGTITKNNQFNIEYTGNELTTEEQCAVKSVLRHSSHPLSLAIYTFFNHIEFNTALNFNEIPGKGISGECNGIQVKIGSPEFTGVHIANSQHKGSFVCINIQNNPYGYFTLKNFYREGFEQVISDLQKHYSLHLLSGDNENEKSYLRAHFQQMHFNQKPEDKLNYIKWLQEKGRNVLMMGDGLNDAGALQRSNVGISLADNVYQFSPSCDAILSADQFSKLPRFIAFSGSAMKILYASFVISFLYNVIGLSYAFFGNMKPVIAAILMPVSSVTVVAFASFSVLLLAKAKKII